MSSELEEESSLNDIWTEARKSAEESDLFEGPFYLENLGGEFYALRVEKERSRKSMIMDQANTGDAETALELENGVEMEVLGRYDPVEEEFVETDKPVY